MRQTFAEEITKIGSSNEDLVLLSGDIGNKMFDKFKGIAPKRFFNCGIAESNMMSMASGMALRGLRPIVYTITPFTTTRCLEQIKIGAAYHKAPVIIVGTGSGLSYAELGPTHHSFEDIAILRSIPDLNILAPCDSNELKAHLRDALKSDYPTYIRIGKKGEPQINFNELKDLGIGKSTLIKKGDDILILGIGPILAEAINAANLLAEKENLYVGVASISSIKPLDKSFLLDMADKYKRWVSIEEHSLIGGLGSTLLEFFNDNNLSNISLKRLGINDCFINKLGNQNFLRKKLRIDHIGIYETLKRLNSN